MPLKLNEGLSLFEDSCGSDFPEILTELWFELNVKGSVCPTVEDCVPNPKTGLLVVLSLPAENEKDGAWSTFVV